MIPEKEAENIMKRLRCWSRGHIRERHAAQHGMVCYQCVRCGSHQVVYRP